MNLILVDDDQDVRRALARMLRTHGHEVQSFASAEAYLSIRRTADCAILDLELPGISGLELGVRMRDEGHGIPVVFISGHERMALAAFERLSIECLMKPFDEGRMLDAIAQATGR